MEQPLPKFDRPPVVEVALSVQFQRLKFPAARLALSWKVFREQFPRFEEKPEIDQVIERFDLTSRQTPGVRFEVGAVPASRLWFLNDAGTDLVQIQANRFIRNWRKVDDASHYPSYSDLRERFLKDLNRFERFILDEFDSELVYNQCEVTYVNIVDQYDSSCMPRVLSWVSGDFTDQFNSEVEEAELALRFVQKTPEGNPWGRLHIAATPVLRKSDDAPAIRLSLTGRGEPETPVKESAIARLDACHESVVRGFTSITTKEMHSNWERKL